MKKRKEEHLGENGQAGEKTSYDIGWEDSTVEKAQVREGERKCQYQRVGDGRQAGSGHVAQGVCFTRKRVSSSHFLS